MLLELAVLPEALLMITQNCVPGNFQKMLKELVLEKCTSFSRLVQSSAIFSISSLLKPGFRIHLCELPMAGGWN